MCVLSALKLTFLHMKMRHDWCSLSVIRFSKILEQSKVMLKLEQSKVMLKLNVFCRTWGNIFLVHTSQLFHKYFLKFTLFPTVSRWAKDVYARSFWLQAGAIFDLCVTTYALFCYIHVCAVLLHMCCFALVPLVQHCQSANELTLCSVCCSVYVIALCWLDSGKQSVFA